MQTSDKRLTVGLVQPNVCTDVKNVPADNDRYNLRHSLELLGKYEKDEVDLVVFPECYPLGHTLELENCDELLWEARRLGSYIFCGEIRREDDRFYNSLALVSPDGRISGRYDKMHLMKDEAESGLSPGKSLKIFDIKGVPVGPLICSDFYDEELPKELVRMGAELLVSSTNAHPCFAELWRHDLIYTAAKRKVPIIQVNSVARQECNGTWLGCGHSRAVVPFVRELTRRELFGPETLIHPSDFVVLEMGDGEGTAKCTLDIGKYNAFREKPSLFAKK